MLKAQYVISAARGCVFKINESVVWWRRDWVWNHGSCRLHPHSRCNPTGLGQKSCSWMSQCIVVWSRVRQKAVDAKGGLCTSTNILTSVTHGSKAAELLLCHSRALPLLPVVILRGKPVMFYHTRYIWKFCYNATLSGCCLYNKTHKILNVFGVSMFSTKQNRKSRVYDVIGRRRKDTVRVTG